MKKLLLILVYFPLLLFSQSNSKDVVFYKNGFILNNFGDTIFNSVVNKNGLIKSSYHYELGCREDGNWVICPEVEILGWSKQGLVAYLTSNGVYDLEKKICLTIQDLVSDEVLERNCDLNKGDIHLLFHQYGIINQDAKYFSKISEYNIDLITSNKQAEGCGVQDIEYQINISHSKHGQKNVADGLYHCVNDLGVFGYFKSPFEDRILIILYYMPHPVEWEPYYINGYGSSLNPSTFN